MKFNDILENLNIYEAGKPIEEVVRKFGIKPNEIIKLASNENPYGCSSSVKEAIIENAYKAALYPDDSMLDLKNSLSEKFDVKNENLILGAGSDQIIEFIIHAKANRESKILMAGVTFAMYEIYASHVGAKAIRTESKTHNLDEFKTLYEKHKPEIVFLCVPNNPLGECLDSSKVVDFIKYVDKNTLVVLDGAYQEFAAFKDKNKELKPKELIENFNNVIYLGTFSKAYGLGGMRVGYGIADTKIISALYKIRPPFNVGVLSLLAAQAALLDSLFVHKTLESNFKEMAKYEKWAESKGIEFINSYTNFLTFLFKEPLDSTKISDDLLQKGVIVRNLKSYGLNAIRITIGTESQNVKVLELLNKIV